MRFDAALRMTDLPAAMEPVSEMREIPGCAEIHGPL